MPLEIILHIFSLCVSPFPLHVVDPDRDGLERFAGEGYLHLRHLHRAFNEEGALDGLLFSWFKIASHQDFEVVWQTHIFDHVRSIQLLYGPETSFNLARTSDKILRRLGTGNKGSWYGKPIYDVRRQTALPNLETAVIIAHRALSEREEQNAWVRRYSTDLDRIIEAQQNANTSRLFFVDTPLMVSHLRTAYRGVLDRLVFWSPKLHTVVIAPGSHVLPLQRSLAYAASSDQHRALLVTGVGRQDGSVSMGTADDYFYLPNHLPFKLALPSHLIDQIRTLAQGHPPDPDEDEEERQKRLVGWSWVRPDGKEELLGGGP